MLHKRNARLDYVQVRSKSLTTWTRIQVNSLTNFSNCITRQNELKRLVIRMYKQKANIVFHLVYLPAMFAQTELRHRQTAVEFY